MLDIIWLNLVELCNLESFKDLMEMVGIHLLYNTFNFWYPKIRLLVKIKNGKIGVTQSNQRRKKFHVEWTRN